MLVRDPSGREGLVPTSYLQVDVLYQQARTPLPHPSEHAAPLLPVCPLGTAAPCYLALAACVAAQELAAEGSATQHRGTVVLSLRSVVKQAAAPAACLRDVGLLAFCIPPLLAALTFLCPLSPCPPLLPSRSCSRRQRRKLLQPRLRTSARLPGPPLGPTAVELLWTGGSRTRRTCWTTSSPRTQVGGGAGV
jgi:hypothetical protein